jgi:membrane protein implicated in regulation of membrane protease activity
MRRRHWKFLILAAVLLAAIAGGGKLVAFAVITLLLPVYGLLWMSMFLIGFIILACIVLPISHKIIENRLKSTAEDEFPEEPRRAA